MDRQLTNADITIAPADPGCDACLLLSEHSWAEQNGLYGDIDRAEFRAVDFTGPRSAFIAARAGEHVVACGALLPLPGKVAEVRRMCRTRRAAARARRENSSGARNDRARSRVRCAAIRNRPAAAGSAPII